MSGDRVIEISGLSKAYPLYARPMDILKEMVLGGVRHDLFWALRDVSFSVRSGQRVGIIGPNGAGKSTLLQIIAGNLLPTSGSVEVHGKISALLSLVPAWNVEQTGIENIRFNLLLQGCSTAQISGLTRDIVDFAELGAFIHQPVKTYSTGMSARLSFAIATAISPEILIVDEVLGVGDGYFAGKAMRRMKEMCDKGKALLFVSHAIAAVRQLCDTAIWLESGGIRLMGPVDYVTAKYDEDMARSDDESVREANIQRVEKSLQFASPDDIPDPDMVRFRLRAPKDAGAGGVYYVRDLRVRWQDDSREDYLNVPVDTEEQGKASYIDALGCEWGRLFTKQGIASRMLVSRTGARKGGHFLVRRPEAYAEQPWEVRVDWVALSEDYQPDLVLESIDLMEAAWTPLEVLSKEVLADGWTRFTAGGAIMPANQQAKEDALILAQHRRLSPIEITSVKVCIESGETNMVREGEPFQVKVDADCLEDAPKFCICLQINRSDGVYIFWQPSDFERPLDTSEAKKVTLSFHFDENHFSSGDYDITVTAVTSPWHKDIVQSEVETFDRKISAMKFHVSREIYSVQFGAVNHRARVSLQKSN